MLLCFLFVLSHVSHGETRSDISLSSMEELARWRQGQITDLSYSKMCERKDQSLIEFPGYASVPVSSAAILRLHSNTALDNISRDSIEYVKK